MSEQARIIAYGSIPHDNGVFSHYRALRAGLAPHGWDVRCVSVGAEARTRWNPSFVDDGCVNIAVDEASPEAGAKAFARWCDNQRVSVVIPEHVPDILASLKHLPAGIRVVHACMDLFPEALELYECIIADVDRMITATPRQHWELRQRELPAEKLETIPFAAMDTEFRVAPPAPRNAAQPLQIAWVARMNHHQKGVRWMPAILDRLHCTGIDFHARFCGDGADRGWLEQSLAKRLPGTCYAFEGRLRPREIANVLRDSHVYILPTRYEGFGISIVEAMMAGCAPVVTRLSGITESIVNDGEDGRLCPLGDVREFVAAVASLVNDREALQHVRCSAQQKAMARFSLGVLGLNYHRMLQATLAAPFSRRAGVPWSEFTAHQTHGRNGIIHRLRHGRLERWLLDRREVRLSRSKPTYQ